MRSITDLAKLTEELVRHVGDPKKVAASEPYPVNTYCFVQERSRFWKRATID